MVFLQIDITRAILIYGIQLGMGIIYLLFGIAILKRSRKRINRLFSAYYLLSASAAIVNVIYAPLTNENIVKPLHILTVGLFYFAPLYLLLFCLIISKSEKVFTKRKLHVLTIIYLILFVILGLIGFIGGGVTINESTEWRPVWSFTFFIYLIIVFSFFIVLPVTYICYSIYQDFEDQILKKRWLYFAIGIVIYFGTMYLICFSNFINNPTFRLITNILALSAFVTAALLYYGVGRQIEK